MTRRILFSIALILIAAAAGAATVRGTIQRPDGTAYPAAAVTLDSAQFGRSATALTADDGVFQLRNVPPGDYTMEVKTRASVTKRQITVVNQPQMQIPAVRVP